MGRLATVRCSLCPRACSAPRGEGFCGAGDEPEVAAVCIHRGEEPPLVGERGMVNIFFAHCNLQCVYCQNGAISRRGVEPSVVHYRTVESVARRAAELLPQSSGLLGFVTAAHSPHLVRPIVEAVRALGLSPTVVYNSGGYETAESLRSLEGLVDIYLPDLKYMDPALAELHCHAPDYPQVAAEALLEMKRQVGSGLIIGDDGVACRGMIVRHLVLPGAVDNSLRCLRWLADNMPRNLHVSLMSQYYPAAEGLPVPLDRPTTDEEYRAVADGMAALGLDNGWTQLPSAAGHYRPDFSRADNPFEPTTTTPTI